MSEQAFKRDEIHTRKIVFDEKYSDPYQSMPRRNRVIEDSRRLRAAYRNFYPSLLEARTELGIRPLLCIQGFSMLAIDVVEIPYGASKNNVLLNCKILFPKDYPRARPTISVLNPNENLHQCNQLYQIGGVAQYIQNPVDKKYYLFFNVPRLREWSPKSDLVRLAATQMQVMKQITLRMKDNFPFVRIQPLLQSSKSHQVEKDAMHPMLKKALDKTELEESELESQFMMLNFMCKQSALDLVYHQFIKKELQKKEAGLGEQTRNINRIVESYSLQELNPQGIDRMLNCTDKSMRALQLASERDALEECLTFLKEQLKNRVPYSEVDKPLRALFEQMFSNQHRINSLE